MLNALFFYSFAALTLGGAILTISLKNVVYCAVSLAATLVGVAGLFLLRGAEFLFAVQIILYVGGILLLFLFVIMLVNLDQAARERQYYTNWPLALACVIGLGFLITLFAFRGAQSIPHVAGTEGNSSGNTEQIADQLFSGYLLPFEVVSVLMLVAIVGAVMMAKRRV